MNEAETRATLIDPALTQSGWLPGGKTPYRRVVEVSVAPGRVAGDGSHPKPKKADYVLYVDKTPVAVVEAKADTYSYAAGETQARFYANALDIRFAYSTNGQKFLEIDMNSRNVFSITWRPSARKFRIPVRAARRCDTIRNEPLRRSSVKSETAVNAPC